MQSPVQITFRGFEGTGVLRGLIEDCATELEGYYDELLTVRTVVEVPHRHQTKGNRYHVKIALEVPGADLIIDREPEVGDRHTHPDVAVLDAFRKARERLIEFARIARGDVKSHEVDEGD